MNHPLIKHKITMLRDERTGTNEFRKLVEEIAMLMGYEALSDLKMREVEIKTPIEDTVQPVLDGKSLLLCRYSGQVSEWSTVYLHFFRVQRSVI